MTNNSDKDLPSSDISKIIDGYIEKYIHDIGEIDYFYASPRRLTYQNNIDRFYPIRLSRLISTFDLSDGLSNETIRSSFDVLCKMRIIQWQVMTKDITSEKPDEFTKYDRLHNENYDVFRNNLSSRYSNYCIGQLAPTKRSRSKKKNNDLYKTIHKINNETYNQLLSTIKKNEEAGKNKESKDNSDVPHIIIRDGEMSFYGIIFGINNALNHLMKTKMCTFTEAVKI